MTHPVISATPASTNNLHQRHPAFITAATALLTRFCCVDTAETIRSLSFAADQLRDTRGYRMNGGLVSLAAFPGAWMNLIGVDVGGTFTDLVLADTDTGRATVHKVPTTPDDPSIGVTEGVIALCAMADLNPSRIDQVLHGTTIATNAVLEHRGAVTGLITTRGYRDILHIGRHQRPQHYSLMQLIPWQSRPFVQRRHRLVVSERLIPPRGDVLVPLDEDEVRAAARALREDGVESIAICFLFSYLNPVHEARRQATGAGGASRGLCHDLGRGRATISGVRALHDGSDERLCGSQGP